MYKDAYPSNHNIIQVSAVQIVMVVVILLVSFVLPATLIERSREQDANNIYSQEAIDARQAQVAGIQTSSTDATVHIPVINADIDLNSETGVLISATLLLAGVACIITIYLLISPRKKH